MGISSWSASSSPIQFAIGCGGGLTAETGSWPCAGWCRRRRKRGRAGGRADIWRAELWGRSFVFVKVFAVEVLGCRPRRSCRTSGRVRARRREGADGLAARARRSTRNSMRWATPDFHQAIDLVDQREGFAGAGRHGDEHLRLRAAMAFSIAVLASIW